jgi:hypothetical protein
MKAHVKIIVFSLLIGLTLAGSVTYARINNPTATNNTTVTADAFVAEDASGISTFAGDVHIATTTAVLSQFALESEQGDGNDYIFYIGDEASTTLFSIDKDGKTMIKELFLGEPDLLHVYGTSTQAVTSGTFEPVFFGVAHHAKGDMAFTVTFDGDASSASTTIPHTSDYDIHVGGTVDKTGGAAQTVQIMLFINNVEEPSCYSERTINSNTETGSFSFRCIQALTEGDILTVKAKSSGGETQFASIGSGVTGNQSLITWIIERLD